MTDYTPLAAEILRLTIVRGADKSICPSEVARALAPGEAWRGLMPAVRRAAIGLARSGRIDILRKGRRVPLDDRTNDVKGVIRLRIARADTPASPEEDPVCKTR